MTYHDVHVFSGPGHTRSVKPRGSEAVEAGAGEQVVGGLAALDGNENCWYQTNGDRHDKHQFRKDQRHHEHRQESGKNVK